MSLPVSGLDCPQNKLRHVPSDIIHPAQAQLPKSSKQVPKAAFHVSKLSVWLRRVCLDPCVSCPCLAGTWAVQWPLSAALPAHSISSSLLTQGTPAEQSGAFLALIN